MILRRLLCLAVLSVIVGAPCAGQGVKTAGEPAGDHGGAPKKEKEAAAKPKKKGAPAKGKKKPAAESKYKSRALAEGVENAYRFDENANPVEDAKKKKAKAKKKSSAEAEPSDDKPACSVDETCSDKGKKSSDADAL